MIVFFLPHKGALALRVLWAIAVQWPAFIALKLAATIIGLFVCALFCAWPCPKWPRLAQLWAVAGDGNPWTWGERPRPDWATKYPALGRWWYTAVRNPVNGQARLLSDPVAWDDLGSWTETDMEPKALWLANKTFAFRWRSAGWKDGMRIVWIHSVVDEAICTYSEFYWGFKIGSPVPGLGFGTQVRLGRKVIW